MSRRVCIHPALREPLAHWDSHGLINPEWANRPKVSEAKAATGRCAPRRMSRPSKGAVWPVPLVCGEVGSIGGIPAAGTGFVAAARRRGIDMVHVDGEIVINRPVEEVFDFVADERNEPRYNPRMRTAEQITAGPIGVGTRFRAVTVSMGRSVEMIIEVTGYERPGRLASMTHMSSMDLAGALTFDPVAGGTRMRWSWELQLRGVLRLVSPLVARIGRGQERRIWTDLKGLLEGKHPTPASA
jgi:hypothetical protein